MSAPALPVRHAYGLHFSARQETDQPFRLTAEEAAAPLPKSVNHIPVMPDVYDQGRLGSCVDNAVSADVESVYIKEGLKAPFVPARLFGYYNARDIEGTTDTDSGSTIRDGVMAYVTKGFVPEEAYPYDITKFTQKPSDEIYAMAQHGVIDDFGYVPQTQHAVKSILAAGYNVIIGFSVYESFETAEMAKTGIMPVPDTRKEELLGGHGVLVVGYDDDGQYAWVRNSWSAKWGIGGYFKMPYAVLFNPQLANDFWTIRVLRWT